VTPDELQAELTDGRLRPAYLLAGEEALLRDDALEAIRLATLGAAPQDFDLDRLDGASATPGALLDAVRTLPVLAPRRLVVVRDPDPPRGGRGLGDAIAEAVAALAPDAETVLVVVAARADARARWVKAFGKSVVRCDPPRRGRAVAAFVAAEARRQGVALEPGAAQLLAERVGPQLLMLRQEIAKAALLAGPGHPVQRSHVASGTSQTAEEPIWDLTDAIGDGRVSDALVVLSRLQRAGAAPPLVLGSLASHFRRLLRLASGERVAGPPFVVRKLEGQARRYRRSRLLACLRAIHETDIALKGVGALRPETALERLVIALAG
jgi:DNA polymerase-3 subunit delta